MDHYSPSLMQNILDYLEFLLQTPPLQDTPYSVNTFRINPVATSILKIPSFNIKFIGAWTLLTPHQIATQINRLDNLLQLKASLGWTDPERSIYLSRVWSLSTLPHSTVPRHKVNVFHIKNLGSSGSSSTADEVGFLASKKLSLVKLYSSTPAYTRRMRAALLEITRKLKHRHILKALTSYKLRTSSLYFNILLEPVAEMDLHYQMESGFGKVVS